MPSKIALASLALLLPLTALAAKADTAPKPPVAEKKPVVDTYHGTEVEDPYQWLESTDEPKVQEWTQGQNAYTRAVLDKLPGREAIRQRLGELFTWQSPAYFALMKAGDTLFALKSQPPRQQPLLVVLGNVEDVASERVLLDPMEVDPSGKTSIDFYEPSLDGQKVAISLSKNGTESGDVSVYDVATGKPLPGEVVPRVNGGTAGGSLAWSADGKGYFYTRYPRGTERSGEDMNFFQQVYFHRLGTPSEKDTYALGKDFPRIAMTQLETSRDGQFTLALVANGDGGEFALYLFGASGQWAQVSRFEDKVVRARFGKDGALYLLSLQNAPRGKVLRLPLATPSLDKATVLVPEGPATLQDFLPTPGSLYIVEQLGGPSQLRRVDLKGQTLGLVPTLPVSSVGGMVLQDGDDILFANASNVKPLAWYRYAAQEGKVLKTALVQTSPKDISSTEVIRDEAVSKDGTRIPLTILKPQGVKLTGNNPTLLTGYGGFNASTTPGFSKAGIAWLEQGGIIAIANLRGGSEFGEEWHANGSLTKKQNVFDDFYACAKLLVEKKYTQPKKLGIQGGSNGGLLMGAELIQHPEMFGAVVALVGIYDMLRSERTPNGQFNTTEFGSVKDPEQFKALYAYSPYHHVEEGKKYPPTLFTAGANDPRVDPFHSRKMVARLQAATDNKSRILLRTASGGHGGGTPLSERIEEMTDVYAFLFNELGVKYRPVKPVAAPKAK
ncbi:prolyl oligopeptidase family serine peptidase [Stigmatella sp. ncwal1]|uniref:prolyl oligopeptidase n=1 Tax=Stigmatella ashevillensis TaxID=2995309 RepID=A0ABT5D3K8_9BACT|nr:prolyl oligopeptidase family serine peptidase [Stigmatella ashevillena]MDC0708251.1 prolyl oligopeptidase family serine peptidase [Stigmatella ashevillena]